MPQDLENPPFQITSLSSKDPSQAQEQSKPPQKRGTRRMVKGKTSIQPLEGVIRTFSSVRSAREALRERVHDVVDAYLLNAKAAAAAGEFESARQSFQWLLEHMPKDDDGVQVIDHSVDKPKSEGKVAGPTINLGFALGGIKPVQGLPEAHQGAIEGKEE
jgi:hypothetical protein